MLYINDKPYNATHFAWDACHKIYLIGSDADREEMNSYGWDSNDYHPIAELPQAWENSCGLRFISWADLDRPSPVPQFAEEDGPVTIDVRPHPTMDVDSTPVTINHIPVTHTRVLNGSVAHVYSVDGKKGRVQVLRDGTVNVTGRYTNVELAALVQAALTVEAS